MAGAAVVDSQASGTSPGPASPVSTCVALKNTTRTIALNTGEAVTARVDCLRGVQSIDGQLTFKIVELHGFIDPLFPGFILRFRGNPEKL